MSKKEDIERKKKIQELKEAREKAGIQTARAVGKAGEERDAELENQTAKRYEKVGVSPIYSKGTFSAKTANNDNDSDITQDLQDKKKKKK